MKYIIILSLFMFSCAQDDTDCGFLKNQYDERISWLSTPVSVSINNNVPNHLRDDIYAAADQWNKDYGRDLIIIKSDSDNVISFEYTWPYDRKQQAITRVIYSGNIIIQANIIVNSRDYSYYSGHETFTNRVNMKSLMIHELGHVLGLGHKDNITSVMYPYLAANTEYNRIYKIDLNSLLCEYR